MPRLERFSQTGDALLPDPQAFRPPEEGGECASCRPADQFKRRLRRCETQPAASRLEADIDAVNSMA